MVREKIKKYNLTKVLGINNDVDGSSPPANKCRRLKYDRARAYNCVFKDYMSPTPLFDDKQFERVFRIKRSMVDKIINDLASRDPFWTLRRDATGELSHSPVVKFLAAQKMLCYGVSVNAFKDYFQMGESTGNQCLSKLCVGIVTSLKFSNLYLRTPTKSDAKRIVQLHKDEHNIDGMLGSLDVTKIYWSSCPAAWKGQWTVAASSLTVTERVVNACCLIAVTEHFCDCCGLTLKIMMYL